MLPVVDSFREAKNVIPVVTEREANMHNSFGSLLTGILNIFDKYGFKEFDVGSFHSDIIYLFVIQNQ